MENKVHNESISPLKLFQNEVARLKQKEIEAGSTDRIITINPEELREEDLVAYEKYKEGALTKDEWLLYSDNMCNKVKNPASCQFAAYLGNRMMRDYRTSLKKKEE